MRDLEKEKNSKVKEILKEKTGFSPAREALLFKEAELLLSARREKIAHVQSLARDKKRARSARAAQISAWGSSFLETLAVRPDIPALITISAALALAFIALHTRPHTRADSGYVALPELAKNNDFPAHYDQQVRAEQQAYEKEVLDAHEKTSGGK